MSLSRTQKRRLSVTVRHILPATSSGDEALFNAATAAQVDEHFASYFAQQRAPGFAYGVVLDGKLVHTGGLGKLRAEETEGPDNTPQANSLFRIASMSKSFVASAVLLLRDEGVLQLDDTLQKWVPELRGLPLATEDSRPPTLRQFLSMHAGYPEDDPWADRLESMSDMSYTKLIREPKTQGRAPGVAYEYSNFGFTLLGRVIQNASGRNFRDFITDRIIAPLGLKDTVWSDKEVAEADQCRIARGYHNIDGEWVAQPIQPPGAFAALAGIYSTVADLSVWVSGFVDAFPARDYGSDNGNSDKGSIGDGDGVGDGDGDGGGGGGGGGGDNDFFHPLSRSSRREMQQVHTHIGLVGVPSALAG
jgi:CubicO group peptidase (beta-lactamase class C family)